MNCLALDIGGANLKASDGERFAISRPFALWQSPERLAIELSKLISDAPEHNRIAVTMTGELADCFPTKAEGVRFIISAAVEAAQRRAVRVYLTDGRLVSPEVAASRWRLAAASNWHALASFACREVKSGYGVLIDIGSTTTDIVPLSADGPSAKGQTDTERLISHELVYTGVERTPLCAAGPNHLPYRGQQVSVARELFATMRDVYLILGELAEAPHDTNTADGRPATHAAALARLARMICADLEDFSDTDAMAIATAVRDSQLAEITAAVESVCRRLPGPPSVVVMSGQGEFMIPWVLDRGGLQAKRISLAESVGAEQSHCAPAHALAKLANTLGAKSDGEGAAP